MDAQGIRADNDMKCRAESLGVNWSDKSHIKTTWDLFFGRNAKTEFSEKIASQEIKTEETTVSGLEPDETQAELLAQLLDWARGEDGEAPYNNKQRESKRWLEDRIDRLARLNADIELALRNTSR